MATRQVYTWQRGRCTHGDAAGVHVATRQVYTWQRGRCTRAEQVICAGDIVGYGHDPSGVIRILREREIPAVMGNHDAAVVGWRDTDDMIGSAREGTARHCRELGKDELGWHPERAIAWNWKSA